MTHLLLALKSHLWRAVGFANGSLQRRLTLQVKLAGIQRPFLGGGATILK